MTQELADKLAAVEQGVARGRWRTDPDVIVESHKVYTEIMELRAAVQVYRDAKRVADLLAAKARHADLESRLWVPATTQTVEPITDRKTLERIAERALYGFYPNYVPNPAEFPCTCKLTLPLCAYK